MAKTIQVIVDVESESVTIASDKALTLTQQIKLLRAELQKTPEGTKEFNLLVTKLNDTQDALGRVNIKGKELFGTLGLIPGPIGEIAARTNSAIDAIKVFGSLKVSDIKAQLTAFADDLTDVIKTIGKLTGITKAYTVLNNALAASFQKVGVGEAAAAAGARALSAALIATGIGALIVLLGTAASALYEMATGEKEAERATLQLNKALDKQNELLELNQKDLNRRNKVELAELKAQGASAQKIRETQLRQAKESYEKAYADEQEAVKLYNDNLGKADAEGLKKLSDNLTKRQQATKDAASSIKEVGLNNKAEELKEEDDKNQKLAAKKKEQTDKAIAEKQREIDDLKKIREQALAAIVKGEEDAFKATLTAREKEEYEINQKYAELIADATKYGQDVTLLQIGLQAELEKLRNKNSVEDTEAFEEKLEKDLKAIEDANKKLLDAETIALELKYVNGLLKEEEYQLALFEIKNRYATSDQERQQAEIDLIEFANKKKDEFVEATKKANDAVVQSYFDLADNLGTSFTTIANLFEKGSDAAKAFAIIGVLLNAASAIGKAKLATMEAITEFGKAKAAAVAYAAIGTAMLPLNPVQGAALIASATKAGIAATAGAVAAKAAGAIQIATIGITSAAQVASILATKKDSKSVSAGAGGGGSTGQATTPAFGGTVNVPAPVIGASQATQSGNLGQTIVGAVEAGNSRNRPIQAYVIGDQVTTQQQLDRRIAAAAKMGG